MPREAVVGIIGRSLFPPLPADVMLFGGQADLLARLEPAELLVSPHAGELATDPRMGRLGEDEAVVFDLSMNHSDCFDHLTRGLFAIRQRGQYRAGA